MCARINIDERMRTREGPVAAGGVWCLSGGIKSDNNAQNITL